MWKYIMQRWNIYFFFFKTQTHCFILGIKVHIFEKQQLVMMLIQFWYYKIK